MRTEPLTLTELIRDDDFIDWVLNPNEVSSKTWINYLQTFPDQRKTVESAKEYIYILAIDTGKNLPNKSQSQKMWDKVEEQMHEPVESQPRMWSSNSWSIAASVAILCLVGYFAYFQLIKTKEAFPKVSTNGLEQEETLFDRTNTGAKPALVLLPDGSSVLLQPQAHITYHLNSKSGKRIVNLSGDAFFEVVRDTSAPFLVLAYGVGTKVLGTSFNVSAPEVGKEVNVRVKTGRVSVFVLEKQDLTDDEIELAEKNSVVLYADQKVMVLRETGKISKTTEKLPEVENQFDIATQLFVFDETPVIEVFKALESAYNVKFQYDYNLLKNCPLTATLVGQPFGKKLSVICNAIDAQYEIKDDTITIIGTGCEY